MKAVLLVGVLAPDLVALKLAEQREGDILRLARPGRQEHARLFGGAAALAVVAVAAGRDTCTVERAGGSAEKNSA